MTITPEEQVWTVVQAIANSHEITPSGGTLFLHPHLVSKIVSTLELKQILNKLEQDEEIIEIISRPDDLKLGEENGCYGIVIPDHEKFRGFLNRAHSQYYGDVNRLAAENFFAVCDVAMDICAELQLAEGSKVSIPLIRDIVRFNTLMPADSINLRDRYCDFRWKALIYLRDRIYIQNFKIRDRHYLHRWEQEITVDVDRYNFDKFYKKLTDAYQRRVVDPQKKNKTKTPKAPEMPPTLAAQKIEITAMPELQVRNAEDNTLAKGKKRIRLPKFKPTDWAKITVRFLDERNVLINADKKEQVVSDYEALGFADEKRGKPNLAWKFFYGLAQNNAETKPLPTPIPDNIKQQKRQLSDCLKTIFKNDTDPFHDPSETRVYKIKINLVPPQSESEEADKLGVQEYLKETMTEEYEEPYNNYDK